MNRILYIFMICLFLLGCKKYHEDNKRSLKSPCKRIGKRWLLTKLILTNSERDISDSVIYYNINLTGPMYSFTYRNMILNFEEAKDLICIGTGRKNLKVENLPGFSGNYYELIDKKENIRMDVIPAEHASVYYFYGPYAIEKLTNDELIFYDNRIKAYCHSVN